MNRAIGLGGKNQGRGLVFAAVRVLCTKARTLALPLALGLAVVACGVPQEPETTRESEVASLRVSEALGGVVSEEFLRAKTPRVFEFPRDHGPHPGFRNEWWYVTGNLDGPAGERLGFHITFFRIGLVPALAGEAHWHATDWSSPDIWMAHTAVVDIEADHHASEERFARDGAGLAGALGSAGRVWVEDWQLAGLEGGAWTLKFGVGEYALELQLEPQRSPVLQGEAGLSQKGPEVGDASYYYSVPRIAVTGEVYRAEQGRLPVTGQAWLDREWSTSVLAEDQVGWDWFALQFHDGLDVMYYELRRPDGTAHERSKGRWMPVAAPDQLLETQRVTLDAVRWATQPSGHRYPVEWNMRIEPPDGSPVRVFTVRAIHDAQEMETSIHYWEGAVDLLDTDGRKIGRGFAELTGYAEEE